MDDYAREQLRAVFEAGTWFRLKVTGVGDGATKWLNVSPEDLGAMLRAVGPGGGEDRTRAGGSAGRPPRGA